MNINLDSQRAVFKKIPKRETQENDRMPGFLFEKFTSISNRLSLQLSKCQQDGWRKKMSTRWMMKGKNYLDAKRPLTRTNPSNNRSGTCLPWCKNPNYTEEEI